MTVGKVTTMLHTPAVHTEVSGRTTWTKLDVTLSDVMDVSSASLSRGRCGEGPQEVVWGGGGGYGEEGAEGQRRRWRERGALGGLEG